MAIGLLVGMIVASSVSYNSCTDDTSCSSSCYYVLPAVRPRCTLCVCLAVRLALRSRALGVCSKGNLASSRFSREGQQKEGRNSMLWKFQAEKKAVLR